MRALLSKFTKHKVIRNAAWLSILQIFNYIAPLIVLPYLTRVLSVDEFGVVMIVITIISIAFVVTDYGFSFSAIHKISRNRNDVRYINQLIARILTAKLFLIVFGLIVIAIIASLPPYVRYYEAFLASIVAVIAQAFFSAWLFQGLERMRFYTIYMASVKILYVALVILVISEGSNPSDVIWCWSVSNFIGAVIALRYVKVLGYKIGFSSMAGAFSELRYSTQFFLSRIAVTLYTSANSVVLGMTSLHNAAIYISAEQGYKAGQAITGSITHPLYPYMANEKKWSHFTVFVIIGLAVITVVAAIVALNSKIVIGLVFGSEYYESASVLPIMMITLVINFLGAVYGYPALSSIDKISFANLSILLGASISVLGIAILYLIGELTPTSVAINALMVESIILFSRLWVTVPFQIKELLGR